MKVIQCRVYIDKANEGSVIQDRTSLLVWFLSVIKWKQLGYEPILYTDDTTKAEFDKLGLSQLYDEVIILDNFNNINKDVFWASAKIMSAKKFIEDNPNEEFIISDLDYIPLKDPKDFATSDDNIVVFYPEYLGMYAPVENIKFNPDYVMPEFFTSTIDPINTCMLYIQKNNLEMFKKYLDIEEDFMNYHYDFINGSSANDLMTFIEQRLFAEYLATNKINIDFVAPPTKSVFNVNGMHTGVYKSIEKVEYWKWIIWWMKLIKEADEDTYEAIISLDIYKDFKEIIDNGKGEYTNKKDRTDIISDFNWDTLEYPRAFEDIYDPVWNS